MAALRVWNRRGEKQAVRHRPAEQRQTRYRPVEARQARHMSAGELQEKQHRPAPPAGARTKGPPRLMAKNPRGFGPRGGGNLRIALCRRRLIARRRHRHLIGGGGRRRIDDGRLIGCAEAIGVMAAGAGWAGYCTYCGPRFRQPPSAKPATSRRERRLIRMKANPAQKELSRINAFTAWLSKSGTGLRRNQACADACTYLRFAREPLI